MANETNRTVTISADYFAELYVKANVNGKVLDELRKERDELKAKLDGDATANGLSPATQKLLETEQRLAAAERCIEDVWNVTDFPRKTTDVENARNIIRAWREKREAE